MTSKQLPKRFAAALVALAFAYSAVASAEPIREADVIRLAARQDVEANLARAQTEELRARELEAGLYPNPSVGWDREHYPSDPSVREDAIVLTMPIDLSGRRASRAALARSESYAGRAATARARTVAVVRALELFYGALVAQERARVLERTAARLAEAVRVVERRQVEGTAAGSDRARLEIELDLARSELSETTAESFVLRSELALYTGLREAELVLLGGLEIARTDGLTAGTPSASRPSSLAQHRAAAAAAREAAEHADTAWLPTITIHGGYKTAAAETTRSGYVAGVEVELPLFSRGQDVRAAAKAREQVAAREQQAIEQSLRVSTTRAALTLVHLRRELERFDRSVPVAVERLDRATQSGYREGTRSVLELLDAERTRADVALRRLELLASAKRAELALRAARGEFE